MKHNWTKIKHIGHRYYRNDTGQIAVADDSIQLKNRPDTTEDGLLLLDFSRNVTAFESGWGTRWNIPLIREKDGEVTSTIADKDEASFVTMLLSTARLFFSIPTITS